MNILIIGSDSFIGGYFIRKYSESYNIKALSRVSTGFENELVFTDFFEIPESVFEDINVVINFAAIVHRPDIKDKVVYDDVNYHLAVQNALKAKKAGVGLFIQMSTIAVYGNVSRITIDSVYDPKNLYSKSKLIADLELLKMEDEQFHVAIVRPSMVYGGNNPPGNMIRLIKLVDKGIPLPFKNIDNQRDFVNIHNLVQYLGLIVDNKFRGVYLISDNEQISTYNLLKIIRKHLHKKGPIINLPALFLRIIEKLRPVEYFKLFGSLSVESNFPIKLKNKYTLEQGIKEMVDFMLGNRGVLKNDLVVESLVKTETRKCNLIITGSSGFVGTSFIKNTSDINIQGVDLLVQKTDEIDFTNVDTVLHLAALVHQMKGAPEDRYFKVNRDLAFEVAKQAKLKGVTHFVFMSTAKVYGESTTNALPWDENSDCNPQDPYGTSKWEAEVLIRSLEDDHFKVAIVRSPLVYGAGVKANMYNLVKLINKCPIIPLGGIRNRRSMVYIGNLTSLLKQVIDKRASGVFIAGDRTPLSTSQLTELIAKCQHRRIWLITIPGFVLKGLGRIKPSVTDRLFGSLELDNHHTNEVLDFIPPFSSEEGIREMVEWYLRGRLN
jgi:UDP-glucose 4-epimerase